MQTRVTLLIALLIPLGCSDSPPQRSGQPDSRLRSDAGAQPAHRESPAAQATVPDGQAPEEREILTPKVFREIKDWILTRGDRMTYCAMYNNNPHAELGDVHLFLNPDTGQKNVNCDPKKSDFNHMVLRTDDPRRYHHVELKDGREDALIFRYGTDPETLHGTDPETVRKLFKAVLANIEKKRAH
jgi:hypothetical protein